VPPSIQKFFFFLFSIPQPLQDPLEHLLTLYSDDMPGTILVIKQFFKDSSAIVAAPLLAPLGQFLARNPPGIRIPDYWDSSVLAPYNILIGDGLHCPMLAAAEEFS
jgi:hypothetical protein